MKMEKRLIISPLVMLVMLVMLLLLIPTTALASMPTDIPTALEGEAWQAITTGGALASGNYYLTDDFSLSSSISIGSGKIVNLHLNDKILTGNGNNPVITITGTGELYLYDVANGTARYWDGSAIVEGSSNDDGHYNFNGGAITGGNGGASGGGGVKIDSSQSGSTAEFTMNGGNIVGNTAETGGGGVNVYRGSSGDTATFTLNKGSIIGNSTTKFSGGGVSVTNSEAVFNMNGGNISGNTAKGNAGGVIVYGAVMNMSGSASIDNNQSGSSGGGIFANSRSTINISQNATISNNNAENGGGIYLGTSCILNIQGGSIQNNQTSSDGGGVFITMDPASSSFTANEFHLSGQSIIINNTKGDEQSASNIYLMEDKFITIDSALGANAQIGITTQISPSGDTMVDAALGSSDLTYTITDDDFSKISSDDSAFGIVLADDKIKLKRLPRPDDYDINGLTGQEQWQILGADGTAINYDANNTAYVYLEDNLDLTTNLNLSAGQNLHLHLNGYILKGIANTAVITVNGGGTLTIYDAANGQARYGQWDDSAINYSISTTASSGQYHSFNGGAITGANGGLNISGDNGAQATVTMHGGNIIGNKATSNGGGILLKEGLLTITGGNISDNISNNFGGGIFIENAELEMSGGIIGGNRAMDGGGIYVATNSRLKLKDAIIISDNSHTITNIANNIYLTDGQSVSLTDALAANAQIGIISQTSPSNIASVDIAMADSGYTPTEDDLARFALDIDQGLLELSSDGSKIILSLPAPPTLPPATGTGDISKNNNDQTPVAEPQANDEGNIEASVDVNSTSQGSITTAQVGQEDIANALAQGVAALADTDQIAVDAKLVVAIEIPTTEATTEVVAEFAIESMTELAGSEVDELAIASDAGTVIFDKAAIDTIANQAETLAEGEAETMQLVVRKVEDKAELTENQQQIVGESPVYELYLEVGGKRISDFGGGKATVMVPEEIRGDEAETMRVYFVDDEGNISAVEAHYDAETGMVTFITDHFSHYLISTDIVDITLPFTDISEDSWYYDSVQYVFQNQIMVGMADTVFEPNLGTTRAMIVTILHRLEGMPAAEYQQLFDDIIDGVWSSEAIIWAAEHKIVEGYGNGLFGPDDNITREQLVAILYRYSEYKGNILSKGAELTGFADGNKVSDWAQAAMEWAVAEQIVVGKGAANLAPQSQATRAEVATILMRYHSME